MFAPAAKSSMAVQAACIERDQNFFQVPVFFETNSKRTAIMNSTRKTRPAIADGRSDKLGFIGPAALAIGGTLSLIWASALGLCSYNLVFWLLE